MDSAVISFRTGRIASTLLALWVCGTAAAPLPPPQPGASSSSAPLTFAVTFDASISSQPYTGRVWVMTSETSRREPRFGPNWFKPAPFFARDVTAWKPGEPLVFDDTVLSFQGPISQLDLEDLFVQPVMALNPDARQHGAGEGNGFGKVVRVREEAAAQGPIRLHINKLVPPPRPPRGERVRAFEVTSRLLSDFHGRPIRITGAAILPPEYADSPDEKFPTLYILPGFGQTRSSAPMYARPTGPGEVSLVRVLLDADCGLGVHEFADSANNGPCGQALIEEVIPYLEKTLRLIPQPTARFLTGHSSGGWASLWLQVTYPDYFGGTWSTSPDPVDFRDFTGINIYEAGANAFRDKKGKRRPIARQNGQVRIWFKQFSDMDNVVGCGEQLSSFEAVFSPRGPGGKPMRLWDRKTGAIDPVVAKAWEKYDIRLVLERKWETLGPRLKGKLHVYVGDEDTFYLEGAVVLLKKSLEKLGSDAKIVILPGHDHGSVMMTPELRGIPKAISDHFRAHHQP